MEGDTRGELGGPERDQTGTNPPEHGRLVAEEMVTCPQGQERTGGNGKQSGNSEPTAGSLSVSRGKRDTREVARSYRLRRLTVKHTDCKD